MVVLFTAWTAVPVPRLSVSNIEGTSVLGPDVSFIYPNIAVFVGMSIYQKIGFTFSSLRSLKVFPHKICIIRS